VDAAAALSRPQERGRSALAVRVVPADERLHRAELAVGGGDDRLVAEGELPRVDGIAQLAIGACQPGVALHRGEGVGEEPGHQLADEHEEDRTGDPLGR
jgi:hypothetical protein